MSEHDEQLEPTKKAPTTTGTLNLAGSPKPQGKINYGFATNQAKGGQPSNATPESGIVKSLYFAASTLAAEADTFKKLAEDKDPTSKQRLSQLVVERSAVHDAELARIAGDIQRAKLDANAQGSKLLAALGALDTAIAAYTIACRAADEQHAADRLLPSLKTLATSAQTTYEQLPRLASVSKIPVVTATEAFLENLSSATKLANIVASNPNDPNVSRPYNDAVAGGTEALGLLAQLTAAERKKIVGAVATFASAARAADDARKLPARSLNPIGVAMMDLLKP